MNANDIITSAKKYGRKIGYLKAKVILFIHDKGNTKATDRDKLLGFSAWRRANDLARIGILEIVQREPIEWNTHTKLNERFFYNLSDLWKQICTDAKMTKEAKKEWWNIFWL